jgi:nucleotide-binding universal stress UspA family protein
MRIRTNFWKTWRRIGGKLPEDGACGLKGTEMLAEENQAFNKSVLIAVDESQNAMRAVTYVAKLLGGGKDFQVSLLHVINLPEEDFFLSPAAKEAYREDMRQKTARLLENYHQILNDNGFSPGAVSLYAPERYCPSIAECILSERETLQSGTIVIGRKGVTRQEEFLFGSVSSMIVRKAKGCAVWVVE